MYVYKYSHFGNHISNYAESAHASLKHSLGTSSGKLMTVTLKVKKWYQELVDDRKCRLMTECLGESTEVVFDKVNGARLNNIRQKISCFAMYKIKLELSKSIISEKFIKECKCLLYYNYLLPYYYTLATFNTIPISLIPRCWRKDYLEGEDNTYNNHLTINNAEPVPANITKITTILPQFDYDLKLVHEGFHITHSKQKQIDIHNLIKNILEKITKQELEDLNSPTIVKAIKGQPKNTKRKMIALEHCIETKKEKDTKKLK
ncbi:hypothetical protein PHYBLDRAFT_173348 [Phycomyces blakesleeanus NRRL 1555(-)]|uniref:Uncharacterized protein n=1 Tax=Phycomyces blakesleeanus (strain ATCC 8743b / DSM 1359 / FGSC 10004 / NBRC 33097 / NRRL 1555) TaxID=763407 RepID=A0A163D311_PHYB8|nr:hypothetical protein PHYBLDRAFT_173348 [Phycomyces blakesleeanus NRRL 1555(-)]OAD68350.1 hypothetical protein PHYBLDRAFT_173348 [Phycomyces blakesleeanus NRRL 1555(-)]|eukprot:XP_018286390.1 hypothetical protein PHYBLDRAFT_173348 [Phycomyces blakesleeanus NRRL 1555(-)]